MPERVFFYSALVLLLMVLLSSGPGAWAQYLRPAADCCHGMACDTAAPDVCALLDGQASAMKELHGLNWGYGYAALLAELQEWNGHPHATVDSIGHSVHGRAVWRLRITNPAVAPRDKRTVTIHARTHPGEVQAWWVTREIIRLVLAEDPFARHLRDNIDFHIIPMLNPDGVELEFPRHNANDLDLEREWDKSPMQPEAAALKQLYSALMESEAPIQVALNMHSAYLCKRYFVYHAASGTSEEFARREREFIGAVRAHFPEGIEAWDSYISWENSAPTHFPESWFWYNFGANVMALTYEDMNCASAGDYDKTALAIVRGIAQWLNIGQVSALDEAQAPATGGIVHIAPNPARDNLYLSFRVARPGPLRIHIVDMLGREWRRLEHSAYPAGVYQLQWSVHDLAPGQYIVHALVNGVPGTVLLNIQR